MCSTISLLLLLPLLLLLAQQKEVEVVVGKRKLQEGNVDVSVGDLVGVNVEVRAWGSSSLLHPLTPAWHLPCMHRNAIGCASLQCSACDRRQCQQATCSCHSQP
jgi:hypothetical protein